MDLREVKVSEDDFGPPGLRPRVHQHGVVPLRAEPRTDSELVE